MSFTVAIVGRPNVGKSTLFNRLVGQKLALVDDLPGVTRDRRDGEGQIGDLTFTIIDTAGFEEAAGDSLDARIQMQTQLAVEMADVCLFLVDARAGITPTDSQWADMLRRSAGSVILVANKCEGNAAESGVYEAFQLGLGDPIPISAAHGEGMADLYEALLPFERQSDAAAEEEGDRPIHVAIVGRPNVGKSTLINKLIGQDRLLTGPEAGITRDAISVEWTDGDDRYRLFDTAGMRKKAKVVKKLERLSVADTLRAIRFSDVTVLVLDAEHPLEKQDLQIADMIAREGRAVVIVINKWDLVDERDGMAKALRKRIESDLPQLSGVRYVMLSGLTGESVQKIVPAVKSAYEVWNKRIGTSALNQWLLEAIARHPPPAVSGRRIKIRYMTQTKARPPTFVVFVSRPSALPAAYTRYLVNGLRDTFGFEGSPIRLLMRKGENPYVKKDKKK